MASLVPPPTTRPKFFGKKPSKYFTLHSGGNNAFTLRLNEDHHTAIVGFRKKTDAIFFARMIETHYNRKKEWPDSCIENLELQSPALEDLQLIHVHEWDEEDLKIICTRNILNMMSVDGLVKSENGYSIEGQAYKFDAPIDFYKERFEEFMGT